MNVTLSGRRTDCKRAGLLALIMTLLLGAGFPQTGWAQWQSSEKGTIVGAAAGGALGSAIGKKSGNPITGAIIGALGGGLVGRSIGDDIDQRRAYEQQQRYYQQQAYQQPNYAQPAGGVSLDQIITLSRNGLSDEVIISHVESNGYRHPLTANDLILLKNNGVSDRVIAVLQRPVAAPAVSQPTVIQPAPVRVVEEVHVVPSWYYHPRVPAYYHGPHYHHRHRSSVNLHFGF